MPMMAYQKQKERIKNMTYKEKKAEARQMAIDWQNKQATESSSYLEIVEQVEKFWKLAKKYGLLKEFKENGII